jgi:putative DNA primase/helicase
MSTAPPINPGEAVAFLGFLDPRSKAFAFQTYDDDKARNDKTLGRTIIGSFEDRRVELTTANRNRIAVHVTINDTKGRSRSAYNVARVRKHFVEIDGALNLEQIKARASDVGLQIAWINESSPGKYHVYFNVAADVQADLAGFTVRQKLLATLFQGGRESVDLARVLRLPGFYHQKTSAPFMVRAVYKSPTARAHMISDFDIALAGVRLPDQQVPDDSEAERDEDQTAIDRTIEHFKTFPEAVTDTPNGPMGKKGNNQTYDAMARAKDFGVDEATCLELALEHYNVRCDPPWSFEELQTLVRNAYAYTKGKQGNRHPSIDFEADPITDEEIEDFFRRQERGPEDIAADKPGMGHNSGAIVWTEARSVKVQNVDYVWKGRLARGKHTLLAGEAGEGKSQIMIDIMARISTGAEWPDGGKAPLGRCVILSAEDDPQDTLVPRLIAAGANLDNIIILKATRDKGKERKFNLEHDIETLKSACKVLGNVVLIGIDPVSSYMGGKLDGGKNTAVRHVLDPLSDLAADLRCAIFSITHFRKAAEGPKAVHRIMDSVAFGAAPRATFGVYQDPTDIGDEPGASIDRRVMLLFKTNLPDKAKGLKYHIEQTTGGVDVRDGKTPIRTLHVVWDGATDLTADSVQRMENEQRSSPRLEEAMAFLERILADEAQTVTDVKAQAEELGIKEDTLRRALRKLKIKARVREGTGGNAPPIWEYPPLGETAEAA